MMIPEGFYGKIFSRSGPFLNNLITAECGVIDTDYRGIVHVCLFNHSDEVFCVKLSQRIAQIVFMEKFDVEFKMVQFRDNIFFIIHFIGKKNFNFLKKWLQNLQKKIFKK